MALVVKRDQEHQPQEQRGYENHGCVNRLTPAQITIAITKITPSPSANKARFSDLRGENGIVIIEPVKISDQTMRNNPIAICMVKYCADRGG